LILYDLSKKSSKIYDFESEKEIEKSINLYGHSAVHYKNSIFIFGGTSSADYLRSYVETSNKFYKLSFNDSNWLDLPCSKGTTGSECFPCPKGTFFFNKNCEPCPQGTFSNKTALTSDIQCLPCSSGSYSDGQGAAICKICPSSAFCPLGSTVLNSTYELTPNQSVQPSKFKKKSKEYQEILNIFMNVLISSGVVILILLFCFKRFRKIVKKWDIFISRHKQELGVPVILRKNFVGGIFSAAFYLTGIFTVIASSFAFGYSNVYEIRALVPLIALDEEVISEQIVFNFTFYMYGDKCEEIHSNGSDLIEEKNIFFKKKEVTRRKVKNNCEVLVKYHKVTLSSSQGNILVQMKERKSSSTAFTLSVTSHSSIPEELSTEIISIETSSQDLAFRGVIPTVFYLKFIPSVFFTKVFTLDSSQTTEKFTGFHILTSQEPTLGGLCSQEE
jgi:hypothetical protein